MPLCCRDKVGQSGPNATKAGRWGGWKCDIPEKTLDNLLEHINKQHPVRKQQQQQQRRRHKKKSNENRDGNNKINNNNNNNIN